MVNHIPIVFIVGGTGAQGMPVVKSLIQDEAYKVRILTRNPKSPRAQQLEALSPKHVELVAGSFDNENDLKLGFRGADYAFINIDGFNTGEKAEIYWTIRAYELALSEGIKFYVHGNLDYVSKLGKYDSKFRTAHYDGKGRSGEWILQQTKDNGHKMGAALFTTGPYLQMSISRWTPMAPVIEKGVVTWRLPLGDGAVAHIDLDDCGFYVRWLFDNQDRANGLDLAVATELTDYNELAAAFTKVTGKPAQYIPTDMETYWRTGSLAYAGQRSSGYGMHKDDPSKMTIQQNFTGFWNVWGATRSDNSGLVKRDFDFLDKIHPGRVKSAEEWFRKEEKRGKDEGLGNLWERVNELKTILKNHEDNAELHKKLSSSKI